MYALAALSLIIDQVVVWIMLSRFPELVSDGDRWFVLARQPWSSIIALVIVLLLVRKYRFAGWGLVLGGAVSNLMTSLIRGRAIDYIELPGGVVTNAADLMICLGLVLVGVSLLAFSPKNK